MKKKLWVMAATAIMTFAMSVSAFAGVRDDGVKGQWIQDSVGWWWQNQDGTYPTNSWVWLDGNEDGKAECYYFDSVGYMAANTKTPDGYQVNENGAWVENGAIVTKAVSATMQTSLQNMQESADNSALYTAANGVYVQDPEAGSLLLGYRNKEITISNATKDDMTVSLDTGWTERYTSKDGITYQGTDSGWYLGNGSYPTIQLLKDEKILFEANVTGMGGYYKKQ